MDYRHRLETEAILDLLISVAEFTIWSWENGMPVGSLKDLEKLRWLIIVVKKQLEAMTLKLWYPLPHLLHR